MQVLAKQFPRMLLQVILRDQLGYVRSDWKGLRKLDQKSQGMFDYVTRAFQKLGLPTDGVSLTDLLLLSIICLEKKLVVVHEYVLKCSVFFHFSC